MNETETATDGSETHRYMQLLGMRELREQALIAMEAAIAAFKACPSNGAQEDAYFTAMDDAIRTYGVIAKQTLAAHEAIRETVTAIYNQEIAA